MFEVVHHTVEFDMVDLDKARKLISYAERIGVTDWLRDHHLVLEEGDGPCPHGVDLSLDYCSRECRHV